MISCIEEKIWTHKVTVIHLMQQVTLHLHVKKIGLTSYMAKNNFLIQQVTLIFQMQQVTLHLQVKKHADDHQLTLFA